MWSPNSFPYGLQLTRSVPSLAFAATSDAMFGTSAVEPVDISAVTIVEVELV